MRKAVEKSALPALLVFSLLLRLWGVADIGSYTGDEPMHIPTAKNYVSRGHLTPENWYHPPLNHLLNYGSMALFGDNPYGWRMKNVLFGTLSVAAIYVLGRKLFSGSRVPFAAALLLALDPLNLIFSRSSYGEVPAMFFTMSAVYCAIRYAAGSTLSGLLAGLSLGLALAIKWYYLPSLPTLVGFVIYCRYKEGDMKFSALVNVFHLFFVLPLGVYLLTFYAWFGRGTAWSSLSRCRPTPTGRCSR